MEFYIWPSLLTDKLNLQDNQTRFLVKCVNFASPTHTEARLNIALTAMNSLKTLETNVSNVKFSNSLICVVNIVIMQSSLLWVLRIIDIEILRCLSKTLNCRWSGGDQILQGTKDFMRGNCVVGQKKFHNDFLFFRGLSQIFKYFRRFFESINLFRVFQGFHWFQLSMAELC